MKRCQRWSKCKLGLGTCEDFCILIIMLCFREDQKAMKDTPAAVKASGKGPKKGKK